MLGRAALGEENVAAKARARLRGAVAAVSERAKAIVRRAAAVGSAASQSGAGHYSGRTPRAMRRRGARADESGDGESRTAGPGVTAEKESLTAAERNPYKRAWYWRERKQVSHALELCHVSGGAAGAPRDSRVRGGHAPLSP